MQTGTLRVQEISGDDLDTDRQLVGLKSFIGGSIGDGYAVVTTPLPIPGYSLLTFLPDGDDAIFEETRGDEDDEGGFLAGDTGELPDLEIGQTYDALKLPMADGRFALAIILQDAAPEPEPEPVP